MSVRDARIAFNKAIGTREPERKFIRAVLVSVGDSVGVSGRNGYVWAQELGAASSLFQVRNLTVQATADLPVIIGWSLKPPYEREVVQVDPLVVDLPNYATDPYLVNHAVSHQMPESGYGADPVLVYQPALQQLKCAPNANSMVVSIGSLVYNRGGSYSKYVGGSFDLTSYKPATGKKRYVLLYLDEATEAIKAVIGDSVSSALATNPVKPTMPTYGIASAYVLLDDTTTSIATSDIVDARDFLRKSFNVVDGSIGNARPITNDNGNWLANDNGVKLVY